MITGAIVGFLLGYLVQEKITGKDYGAGQWQRPSDKKYVSDPNGFIRWLALPLLTAGIGAILSPMINAALGTFIASASFLTLVLGAAAIIGALYLFFKMHVLGR